MFFYAKILKEKLRYYMIKLNQIVRFKKGIYKLTHLEDKELHNRILVIFYFEFRIVSSTHSLTIAY